MKIWNSFGSEHSANLVIIGKFKEIQDAQGAINTLDALAEIATRELDALLAGKVPESVLDAAMKHKTTDMGPSDFEGLAYDHHWSLEGSSLVATTEESNIQGILKVLLRYAAKIEVYSAHNHPSRHGRPTYESED
jgi:hypothetical protein